MENPGQEEPKPVAPKENSMKRLLNYIEDKEERIKSYSQTKNVHIYEHFLE